jgi:hypothetical protein
MITAYCIGNKRRRDQAAYRLGREQLSADERRSLWKDIEDWEEAVRLFRRMPANDNYCSRPGTR